MPDTPAPLQVALCPTCSGHVDRQTYSSHQDWHRKLDATLDSAEAVLEGMVAAIRPLERQVQQLLERVSQLEARTAWRHPSGPPQAQLGEPLTCVGCGHDGWVLILGGRNPGLRCSNCRMRVGPG